MGDGLGVRNGKLITLVMQNSEREYFQLSITYIAFLSNTNVFVGVVFNSIRGRTEEDVSDSQPAAEKFPSSSHTHNGVGLSASTEVRSILTNLTNRHIRFVIEIGVFNTSVVAAGLRNLDYHI